jgi:hypothetical protein
MTSTAMAAGTWEDGEAAEKAGNYAEAVGHFQVCADEGSDGLFGKMGCQYRLGEAYALGVAAR